MYYIVIFLHNYLSSIAIPNKVQSVSNIANLLHSCTILLFFFIIISHQIAIPNNTLGIAFDER